MDRKAAKELFRNDKDSYGKPKGVMHKIDQIYDDFEKDRIRGKNEFRHFLNWLERNKYTEKISDLVIETYLEENEQK